ncbi:MAG: TonB family protein [Oryzomonas sp.]|uniref:energy transducer TonB n=1 Tax=Oryzomonas sp. TaxID=2855186 RepID=UPI0028453303|nr:TonB family protein [Oryzomonas sp.]MDR3581442.1 TonB family protein [Oryzomonas sp.]
MVTRHRQATPPSPVAATKAVRETPAVPSPIKQKVEATPPPYPAPAVAVSPQAKEPTFFHSAPSSVAVAAVPVASRAPAASRSATEGATDTGTVIGPSYGAAYLRNPAPPYPITAKRLKLQGTAIVRVLVSPEGQPKNVELEKTSGVRLLDDAAVEAVKHWSFVPARRGNNRIAASVNVPIRFHLE